MPSKKISALTAYATPILTDLLPIVDVTTNVTKKIQLKDLHKGLNPLVYKAYLTQSGTNAPVETAVYNTIGAIVWTRNAQGQYYGTLAGAFTASKVWAISGPNVLFVGGKPAYTNIIRINNNVIKLETYDFATGVSDDILSDTQVLIEVYP